MQDQVIMDNILTSVKNACDIFMHGAIESSSTDVHQTFATSLGAALRRQEQIYGKMQQKGWYPTDQVQQSKINEVKMKFSQQCR